MIETPLQGIEKYSSAVIKATQPLMDKMLAGVDKEKALEVISNVILDAPSDRTIGLTPSPKERLLGKILVGFTEIEGAFEVLNDIPFYLKRFPSKNPLISKTRFLNYHVGNYLNEVYILRERLRSYRKFVTRMYKKDIRLPEKEKWAKKLDLLISGFDNVVDTRGNHIHQKRYDDEDFDRLRFYEFFVRVDDSLFNLLYPTALREYRDKWVKTIAKNNETVKEILDSYFEIAYRIIFDEQGNWIEPLLPNSG